MNYHIDTALIQQEFRASGECPLCAIRKIVEEHILEQFAEEAVMEDSARARANERGFCAHHFDMLFIRENKLGLALQTSTRLDHIARKLGAFEPKNAAKQAEYLEKTAATCLICDLIGENMTRYAKTAAQMFAREPAFRAQLESTRGFCLEHYRSLLAHSSSAGLKKKEYLAALMSLEQKNLERLRGELQWFCDKHDYRNATKPWGTAEDSIPRARVKLYGLKTK